MKTWRAWPVVLMTVVACLVLGALWAPHVTAQPKDKVPDETTGKFRIHQARLSNREDYTLLLDTTTGRTWVLALNRDGSRLGWFDLGLPQIEKEKERK